MGKVILEAAMSLDGFVADDHDDPGPIFDWYENGDVPVTLADEQRVFHTSPASAAYLREAAGRTAACVIGRRLFDLVGGWDGRPPAGEAVFVVTHRPPADWAHPEAPFTFVGGVAEAVERARAFAGDRDVSVSAGLVGGQALELGLVDEVHVNLTPVFIGRGRRFVGDLGAGAWLLGNPEIIPGDRVTHLIFPVLPG